MPTCHNKKVGIWAAEATFCITSAPVLSYGGPARIDSLSGKVTGIGVAVACLVSAAGACKAGESGATAALGLDVRAAGFGCNIEMGAARWDLAAWCCRARLTRCPHSYSGKNFQSQTFRL